MLYMMYRVLLGLHEEINVSFLSVGHTKFSPNCKLKHHFKRSKVGCLDDIVRVVNESASPNVTQLVGSLSGNVMVPVYDWSSYFDDKTMKTSLKGITQMHHFRFTKEKPGKVMVRNDKTYLEREITLVKDTSWRPNDLPK